MESSQLERILKQAAAAADAVPDDLRSVAFEKTFDLLSAQESGVSDQTSGAKTKPPARRSSASAQPETTRQADDAREEATTSIVSPPGLVATEGAHFKAKEALALARMGGRGEDDRETSTGASLSDAGAL